MKIREMDQRDLKEYKKRVCDLIVEKSEMLDVLNYTYNYLSKFGISFIGNELKNIRERIEIINKRNENKGK
jgi:hypothetical protein